jgi:hypothetical protein
LDPGARAAALAEDVTELYLGAAIVQLEAAVARWLEDSEESGVAELGEGFVGETAEVLSGPGALAETGHERRGAFEHIVQGYGPHGRCHEDVAYSRGLAVLKPIHSERERILFSLKENQNP